eukprot:TRINITY_DN3039_c0_g1_i2.p1 TRINITY_DN3039_c0_g1~~TRINITY_DN3039_c0_g1_i2.p1  ORF type:complete len:412 (+),score=83.35 TRINITY_DN3039_c0_g1_i2:861-2096(+)
MRTVVAFAPLIARPAGDPAAIFIIYGDFAFCTTADELTGGSALACICLIKLGVCFLTHLYCIMEEEPSSKRLKVEGEPAVAEVAPISGADVKDVAAVAPPVENATLATLYENLDDDDEEDDGDFDDNGQQESDDDSIQSDADELDPVDDIPKGEESDASIDAPDRHVAAFLAAQRARGTEPSQLLRRFGYAVENTKEVSDDLLWHLIEQLLCDVRRVRSARCKLLDFNTLEDAVQLFQNSKNIVILTGAGVSVSCGIPDFRSKGGLYETIADEFDLPDPQALFDIHYFHDDPKPFFRFAKELMPGNYQPSLCHKFIKHLEDRGQLLRNYTQNIDTLENVAGIKRIIQCHGSFASATCTECKVQVPSHVIREDVMAQVLRLLLLSCFFCFLLIKLSCCYRRCRFARAASQVS